MCNKAPTRLRGLLFVPVLFALACLATSVGLAQAGSPFGGANQETEVKNFVFDVGRVAPLRTIETPARFERIWRDFRSRHGLDENGEFRPEAAATTQDGPKAQEAFLRYVAANSPVITFEEVKVCGSCTKGKVPYVEELVTKFKDCVKCSGTAKINVVENYRLVFSGTLPPKPVASAPKPASAASPGATPQDSPASVNTSAAKDELQMLMDRFLSLGKKFEIDRDEFTKELRYSPMAYLKDPSASPSLRVSVLDDGTVFMRTLYVGRDWIFHDHFKLMVGEEVFDSAVAPQKMITRKVLRGYVSEVVYYSFNQVQPAEAIAKAPQAKALLRLEGDSDRSTGELTREYKEAIRDAFELSAILKKIYKLRKDAGMTGKLGDVK